MNTMEMWRQAMQPNEGDVLCMDDIAVYRRWVSEIDDGKCPFCGQPVVSRKAMACANSACLFRSVTYSVLLKFGQEAS